jgi:phosphohistidine phosphatase
VNLFMLRHGIAVERGTPGYAKDSDRPLTPKGERKLWQISEAMEALKLSFDMILASPYLRARQTADVVAEALGARKRLEFDESLTPGGNSKDLIELIRDRRPPPESVLLVGHEPYLSQLVSMLISGGAQAAIELKKGGLCKLEVDLLRNGRCASLAWLLTPKQMALMA